MTLAHSNRRLLHSFAPSTFSHHRNKMPFNEPKTLAHFDVYIFEFINIANMCGIMAFCIYVFAKTCNVCVCVRVLYVGIAIKFKCHPLARYVCLYAYDLLPIACKLFAIAHSFNRPFHILISYICIHVHTYAKTSSRG